MTQNSMKALQDMVKLLEDFKVKVTQAASDSNSQTSRGYSKRTRTHKRKYSSACKYQC